MDRLTTLERALLLIPLAGGVVFGLGPLLAPHTVASLTGFRGDDPLVGRYAGAATFGYAAAIGLGLAEGTWRPLRLVVGGVLVFNLASIFACLVEIATGSMQPVLYLILATSTIIVALTSWLLMRRRVGAEPRDVASWVLGLLIILTLLAATFGLLPLVAPTQFASVFGLAGTDTFLFRQAGAATLGYAVVGLLEVRSGTWDELRLPAIMAFVFNAASLVASVVALVIGDRSLLVLVVTPASLAATIGLAAILVRRGR